MNPLSPKDLPIKVGLASSIIKKINEEILSQYNKGVAELCVDTTPYTEQQIKEIKQLYLQQGWIVNQVQRVNEQQQTQRYLIFKIPFDEG